MLKVSQLSCERQRRLLFDALSFEATAGELIQVRGPNGAGKTTLLKTLVGLYGDYEGEITWDLSSPPVFLGHKPGVKDQLTAFENLEWLMRLQSRHPAADELTHALVNVGLKGYAGVPCGEMSQGQRKRVNLARLPLCRASAWLLDEPFAALDTSGVELVESMVARQVEAGGLVILTSHQPLQTVTARFVDL